MRDFSQLDAIRVYREYCKENGWVWASTAPVPQALYAVAQAAATAAREAGAREERAEIDALFDDAEIRKSAMFGPAHLAMVLRRAIRSRSAAGEKETEHK